MTVAAVDVGILNLTEAIDSLQQMSREVPADRTLVQGFDIPLLAVAAAVAAGAAAMACDRLPWRWRGIGWEARSSFNWPRRTESPISSARRSAR